MSDGVLILSLHEEFPFNQCDKATIQIFLSHLASSLVLYQIHYRKDPLNTSSCNRENKHQFEKFINNFINSQALANCNPNYQFSNFTDHKNAHGSPFLQSAPGLRFAVLSPLACYPALVLTAPPPPPSPLPAAAPLLWPCGDAGYARGPPCVVVLRQGRRRRRLPLGLRSCR